MGRKLSKSAGKKDKKQDKGGASAKDSLARSVAQIRGMIVRFFRENPDQNFRANDVGKGIGATDPLAYDLVDQVVRDLYRERILEKGTRAGTYRFKPKDRILFGEFGRKAGKGHNFFYPEDGSESIRIAERNSRHALDGDKVKIQLMAIRPGQEPEGEVLEITERATSTFVGVMSISNGLSFLLTDSNKLSNDILIPERNLNGAKDGEKVVVRVIEWPEKAKNPVGEVLAIIGTPGDNDTEMHAILAEFGLPYVYPTEVSEAADHLDPEKAFGEKFVREDFRGVTTFTIDPKSAKDFDDALSIRKTANGHWEVGVHIADVTAYVEEGDIIDKEGSERGTSVYLVDRTVPMLPERLSNDLCSLKQGVDRPTYSVIFELSDSAKVLDYRITRAVINSDRRFAYEEAQAVIETGEGDLKEEILTLNRLAQILRQERMEEGSVDFDRTDMEFELDESGKPIAVKRKVSKEANKLIEEFMLLANQAVARFVHHIREGANPPAFVYRVHDRPSEDKLHDLAEFVGKLGYKLDYTGDNRTLAKNINKLLAEIKGKPEQNMLEVLIIRSMAKAVYQTDNIGHFGLGFEDYTHFTSPIRRHPDMMVHRLLTRYMAGGRSVDSKELDEICRYDSEREKLAADAERTSQKYKQAEYLQAHLGEEFDGVISGVKDFGIFVELTDNGCEGLVPIRDLDDDYYEMDEKTYALVGYNRHKRYALGDSIRVRVARTDLGRRQIDFELADSAE